eukprot:TRINITY_DN1149_c0_g2_i2.p1 TRINITY_DN1149_c0_g2~~TRINITY_DN1149_c0_g2_i2.p1  ORF type:complete len:1152 (+),score=282.76 TRINITY_DN1149_c0_g2_i2:126-3458(+)
MGVKEDVASSDDAAISPRRATTTDLAGVKPPSGDISAPPSAPASTAEAAEECSEEETSVALSPEPEGAQDEGFLGALEAAARTPRMLFAATLVPLAVVVALSLAQVGRFGAQTADIVRPEPQVNFARLAGRLASALAHEAQVQLMLLPGSSPTFITQQHLGEAQERTSKSLLLVMHLHGEHAGEVAVPGAPSVRDIITPEGLAAQRAAIAAGTVTPVRVLEWFGAAVDALAVVALGAHRRSASNLFPLRRALGHAVLQQSLAAAQREQTLGRLAVELAAAGEVQEGRGREASLAWWHAGGASRVAPAGPTAARAARGALNELAAAITAAEVLTAAETFEAVQAGIGRAAAQRSVLRGFFPSRLARDMLGAPQRRDLLRSWWGNSSAVTNDFASIQGKAQGLLTGSLLDERKSSASLVGTWVAMLCFLLVVFVLCFLVLWNLARDTREEALVSADFEDNEATLQMIRDYCNHIAVWLLDDIRPDVPKEEQGQMELRLRRTVNALYHLRPFVPPWVFASVPAQDIKEAAQYVEKPKYKQPSIDITAEMQQGAPDGDAPRGGSNTVVKRVSVVAPPTTAAVARAPSAAAPAPAPARDPAAPDAAAGDAAEHAKQTEFVLAPKETSEGSDADSDASLSPQGRLARRNSKFFQEEEEEDCLQEEVPTTEEDLAKISADMNWLPRTLNLKQGLERQDQLSIVLVTLANMNSRETHSATRDAPYRDPWALAHGMNQFLQLVSDIAEAHEGCIVKIEPEAIYVGFNLTWQMKRPARCARNACSFATALAVNYQEAVEHLRAIESSPGEGEIRVGGKVEMKAADGTWRSGTVSSLRPLKVVEEGSTEAKRYEEVHAVQPMCCMEQCVGSPEVGAPMMVVVSGDLYAGPINTGTFRSFDFFGPRVRRMLRLRQLGSELAIRVVVDARTREYVSRTPLQDGDLVMLVESADRLQQVCQASSSCEWNQDMADAAGHVVQVQAVHPDGSAEVELQDGSSVRLPLQAMRQALAIHAVGMLHEDGLSWDSHNYEIFCELMAQELTREKREQQAVLDHVFQCIRQRRFKPAERSLQMYIDAYESVEVVDSQGAAGRQGEKRRKANLTPLTARLKEDLKAMTRARTV